MKYLQKRFYHQTVVTVFKHFIPYKQVSKKQAIVYLQQRVALLIFFCFKADYLITLHY